jgi:putative two-component system response regulator
MREMTQHQLKNARILVVDDEPANVKLLEKMLEAEGYSHVVSTMDSRNVLELYQQQASDLVLLDLNMPYRDGFQIMQDLKQISGHNPAPILVLTAQTDRESRLRALDGGARDFVTKPFDRTELLARIRNMIEVHSLQKAIREQNSILEQKVHERTRELYDTRLEIVRRLGRAAEYRDNETGLHIIRMSQISALLGQAAGMDEQEAELLLNASPMHDIGKIGIPDKILLKPGKLDAQEWATMQTHTTIGAEILSSEQNSELLEMARLIALTHHEKWDGSGYPRGLKGEDIPLVGRIVALADVFDALTSERPYKHAWSIEEALGYVKEQSGKHFEPALVEHFLKLLPTVVDIKDTYAEPE